MTALIAISEQITAMRVQIEASILSIAETQESIAEIKEMIAETKESIAKLMANVKEISSRVSSKILVTPLQKSYSCFNCPDPYPRAFGQGKRKDSQGIS